MRFFRPSSVRLFCRAGEFHTPSSELVGSPSTQQTMAAEEAVTKKQPKSFEALTPELSTWILDYTRFMNFTRTTPVQGMAIPLLMGNKDLVVEVRSILIDSFIIKPLC